METLAQAPVFLRVTEFAQQPPDSVRPPPGLSDQPQGGGERDSSRLCILQQAALENAALRGSLRVQAARPIRAKGRARLGKTSDRGLAARNLDRQPERAQLRRIVARFQFDAIEQRAVTAQPARTAEIFS